MGSGFFRTHAASCYSRQSAESGWRAMLCHGVRGTISLRGVGGRVRFVRAGFKPALEGTRNVHPPGRVGSVGATRASPGRRTTVESVDRDAWNLPASGGSRPKSYGHGPDLSGCPSPSGCFRIPSTIKTAASTRRYPPTSQKTAAPNPASSDTAGTAYPE